MGKHTGELEAIFMSTERHSIGLHSRLVANVVTLTIDMNTFLYHVSGRESALFAARQRYARSVHARQMLDARDDDDDESGGGGGGGGGGGRRACLSTVALKDGEREKGARERERRRPMFLRRLVNARKCISSDESAATPGTSPF